MYGSAENVSNLYKSSVEDHNVGRAIKIDFKNKCRATEIQLQPCLKKNYDEDLHNQPIHERIDPSITSRYGLIAFCNQQYYMNCKKRLIEEYLNLNSKA